MSHDTIMEVDYRIVILLVLFALPLLLLDCRALVAFIADATVAELLFLLPAELLLLLPMGSRLSSVLRLQWLGGRESEGEVVVVVEGMVEGRESEGEVVVVVVAEGIVALPRLARLLLFALNSESS